MAMNFSHSLHKRVWLLAWPLLLANLSTPLLGLVNTAVVGHLESPKYLAAVAMGGNYFMFLYFSFNFLRMSTTGLTSQAIGAQQPTLVLMLRALCLATLLGLGLIALNPWLSQLGLWLLGGSDEVQSLAAQYINIRILGAPAALANFALIGFAIGLQRTNLPLRMTFLMHSSNAVLSYCLVYIWHWDVAGVACASVVADYLGLIAALYWLRNEFNPAARQALRQHQVLALASFKAMLSLSRDLFIRSFALLSVFFFFTAQGARLGDEVLAANAILITFLLLLSNFLDGFANAAEALVGEAYGAKNQTALDNALSVTRQWTVYLALAAFIFFLLFAPTLIGWLTDIQSLQNTALTYLPWVLLLPFTASLGFWLDGVYVGATRSRDMRNTMLLAVAIFLVLWWCSIPLDNHGLWLALNGFMLSRGLIMMKAW